VEFRGPSLVSDRHVEYLQARGLTDRSPKLRTRTRQRFAADQVCIRKAARGEHSELAPIGADVDHGGEIPPKRDRLVLDRGGDTVQQRTAVMRLAQHSGELARA
jgi:hypothetical protein